MFVLGAPDVSTSVYCILFELVNGIHLLSYRQSGVLKVLSRTVDTPVGLIADFSL